MTIAHCPRCSEQVSVPESASHEATVRCPFCQDEYSLGEALAQLPPTLIVVSDLGEVAPAAVEDEEDSTWGALNLDDNDAEEVALASMDGASPAAFDFASGSAAAGGKSQAAIRPSSRARKPKGSPIKSILSIVIGGLMAFPIAQLILWYLPGEWKRDFGAGPIVAQYVPQIVPAKFRGKQADAESKSEPRAQDSASVIPDFSVGGFGSGNNNGGENGSANNKKQNSPKKKKQTTSDATTFNAEPPAAEQMSLDDAPADSTDVFATPLEVPGLELGGLPLIDAPVPPIEIPNAIARVAEEPASDSLTDTPLTIDAPKPELTQLAPGNIRNAPQVGANDVVRSIEAAASGNLAWDTDEASVPGKAIKLEFYLSFSKLGEALTFADPADEEVAAQIAKTAKLLQEVGTHPDKLVVIESVAVGWIALSHEKRKTNGICVYGAVRSVESIGTLFETTVESAGQEIAVISTSDPSEYFVADRQVLILGTILDEPAKTLGGYEGHRDVVVLDGYHVVVSAE